MRCAFLLPHSLSLSFAFFISSIMIEALQLLPHAGEAGTARCIALVQTVLPLPFLVMNYIFGVFLELLLV